MDDVERALEQLYPSRYARFEAVLATMTRDRETARDVVQEAFAIALARRRQFRGDGSLEGWVWKIALRLAAGARPASSELLTQRVDPAVPENGLDPALAEAIRACATSPADGLPALLR